MIMGDRYDVAVIGGGLAGLTAATLAARAGARVVLVEPHPLGGRARTTDRDGFRFNQGPHALYEAGEARRILGELGVVPTGGKPALHQAWWWYRGDAHRFPRGAGTLLTNGGLSARAKVGLGRMLATVARLDPAAFAHRATGEWVADLGLPPDGEALVHLLIRTATYTNAPALQSAEAAVLQVQRSLVGVTYLDGGWQAMVDALATVARDGGVELRTGVTVTGLGRTGRGWEIDLRGEAGGEGDGAGRADGHGLDAVTVVLAAGSPARCAALLGADPGWTDAAGPAVLASCLDLGVSAPAARPLLFGADEPIYLSTHAPPADLAPAGMGVIQVAEYLEPDLGPGTGPDAATGRARLHEHARRAGVQDGAIVTERYLHRMPVTHGMPLAAAGGLAGRPTVTTDGLPGLYLAGDWVGGRGLLADAAVASAEEAARRAVALAAEVPV